MDMIMTKNINEIRMKIKNTKLYNQEYKNVTNDILTSFAMELNYLINSSICPINIKKDICGIGEIARYFANYIDRKTDIWDAIYIIQNTNTQCDLPKEYFELHRQNFNKVNGNARKQQFLWEIFITIANNFS